MGLPGPSCSLQAKQLQGWNTYAVVMSWWSVILKTPQCKNSPSGARLLNQHQTGSLRCQQRRATAAWQPELLSRIFAGHIIPTWAELGLLSSAAFEVKSGRPISAAITRVQKYTRNFRSYLIVDRHLAISPEFPHPSFVPTVPPRCQLWQRVSHWGCPNAGM